ncbi:hypothetical protein Aduo_005458 [Ancylostoma duodenale]
MLVVNRFLRTATVTREKLLRLAQRYLLFDTIFAILVKYDEVSSTTRTNFAETMNFREERVKIEKELEKLDKNINKMSRELGIAERRVKDEKGAIAQFQKEKRLLMQEFNNKIREMEDKLENFMFSPIDQKPAPVEQETVVMKQKKQKYSTAKDEPKSQVETLPDEDYMAKLVDEVRDEEDDISINEGSINSDDYNEEPIVVLPGKREPEDPFDSDDDPDYVKKRRLYEPDPISRVKELEQDLDDLHYGQKFLPQRKIGESSTGSADMTDTRSSCAKGCANIVWRIVTLEDAVGAAINDVGTAESSKGQYSTILNNFLIPDDNGHHRALCTIPDSKNKIAQRIAQIKEELRLAEQDL